MKKYIKADTADITEEPTSVRIAVAKDPSTRAKTLVRLANDPEEIVRYFVSINPNTPEGLINEDFPEFEADVTFNLAVDTYLRTSAMTSEIQARAATEIKEVLANRGYEYMDGEWSVYSDFDDVEDEDESDEDEDAVHFVTIYVTFRGYDDDRGAYSDKVRYDILTLLQSHYGVYARCAEYF